MNKPSTPLRTLNCSKILISLVFLRKRDGGTDVGTDRSSYRDARAHLKREKGRIIFPSILRLIREVEEREKVEDRKTDCDVTE